MELNGLGFDDLKDKQRDIRGDFGENLGLRVHRALSWLCRAEQCEDLDGQFIFLWIAFNAAYANDLGEYRSSETSSYQAFNQKIADLDSSQRIYKAIWQAFPNSIRVLLDNPYVFQPYWDWVNGQNDIDWHTQFTAAKRAAHQALANKNTASVLSIVLNRLYTLRNQLIHGGATFNGSINRDQMRDATNIMKILVPLIIDTMMNNPNELWGDACYKVQKN